MTSTQTTTTSAEDILHQSKFTPMQCVILGLSFIACMVEGFDVVIIAFTSPAIIKDWGIAAKEMGWILSAGILGMTLGAMLLSWLGDRYGRSRVSSATLLVTGLATSFVMFTETVTQLIALRLIAGLALGVMMATLTPLVGEYSPRRYRTLILSILLAGGSLGAMTGGLIVAAVIEQHGWQSIFFYTGILTFILGILMYFIVPESPTFITKQTTTAALKKINHTLKYIGQQPIEQLPQITLSSKQESATVFSLLTPARRATTLLCWSAFFCAFVAMYFISSWLPQILVNAGYTQERAIQATAVIPFGAVFGTILIGWLSHWWKLSRLIALAMIIGAFGIFLLSTTLSQVENIPFGMIIGMLLFIGIAFTGGYSNLYTITVTIYPSQIRSTGLGWAAGLGRAGAVISPTIAGMMIDWGVSVPNMFLYFSVPIIISALCVSFIHMRELP